MSGAAHLSPCGTYRYTLRRHIPQAIRWVKPCLFIMLNPSTATAEVSDPTIRRCMGFASRFGCTELTVVNLFALRATNPNALLTHTDPVGPDNNQHLNEQVELHRNGVIVAAWGAHPFARKRAAEVQEAIQGLQCLGVTQDGSPRHPLYVPAVAPLTPWPRVA